MAEANVTQMLGRLRAGDREAFDALLAAMYHELRRLARGHLRRERRDHTLSATGLVHEAWLRLVSPHGQDFENRAHFFGAASQAMRRVLVDHARGRTSLKRKSDRVGLTAAGNVAGVTPPVHELLAVDAALRDLSRINPRLVRVVECRYFAGLTIPETAEALGVSHATISEDWRFARAWLRRALSTAVEPHAPGPRPRAVLPEPVAC
jgi:RNA polymerase sigma-70 factor, ECF subfamily